MGLVGKTNMAPRYQRIGALRKGGEKTATGFGKDLDHFRFTSNLPDVERKFYDVYGKEPRSIRIFLPYKTTDENFPAWRKEYSAGGLVHACDEKHVIRHRVGSDIVDVEGKGIPCPYAHLPEKQKKCKAQARLNVIIPDLIFGNVEVHTSSINDIVRIDAQLRALESTRNLFGETLQGVPLLLTRILEEISTPTKDGRARRKKWMVHLVVQEEWGELLLNAMNMREMKLLPTSQMALPSGESVDFETGEIVGGDDFDGYDYEEDNAPFVPDEPAHETAVPEPPKKPTSTQMKQFHATGKQLYGDEWDTKRGELVKFITDGLATSSKHLTRDELETLVDGMQKKLNN